MTTTTLPSSLAASGNPLAPKISQILASSFIDPDISSALSILESSGFADDAINRRDIGPSIAAQVLSTNKSVLDDYKHFVEEMRTIKLGIISMQAVCDQMRTQALAVKASSSQLIEQSTFLQEQKRKVETKQRTLSDFRKRFSISDSEALVLTSSDPIDETFFNVLAHVSSIREDCSVLLTSEPQTAGVEIMATMSTHLDAGFTKLHRWILKELKSTIGATEANRTLRKAITKLSERRDLFDKTLESVSDARRRAIAIAFDQARIRGTDGSRPLDQHIDDPLRYCGDLLAWLHQSIANEREILDLILGPADEDFESVQKALLDQCFSLVMQPIQQRVDGSISLHHDRRIPFNASILIRFYGDLLARLLAPEAGVLRTLKAMEKSAQARFMQPIRTLVAQSTSYIPDPETLDPPGFMEDLKDDLSIVIHVLASSMLSQEDREREINELFESLVRHALEITIRGASELDQPDSSIFLINTTFALSTCMDMTCTILRKMCSETIEAGKAALQVEQFEYLLRNSQLTEFIESGSVSSDDVMHVSKAMGQLLPSLLPDLHARLEKLAPPKLASQINNSALKKFIDEYEKFENIVSKEIEFGVSMLRFSSREVIRHCAL